ncbi:MAG: TetR/AcrR family transcriptional regulator [Eubacteriaceae bacterium]|nr:TetR/AcrR family transcriptional regulator [Eubacteriaceae bacterium]
MKTREKIKQAAVEMFNEKGATSVSTVQLSERLKISPGNLYYYFDNKEHLIRDIWTEDIITNVDMLFYREDFGHSENGILNFFDDYSKVIYKYRFFFAEVFALLKNDPILLDLYRPRCKKLLDQLMKVMNSWEETGIMNPLKPVQKKLLADALWIMGPCWTNFAAVVNDESEADRVSKDAVVHAYSLLAPNFTEAAKKRISVLMTKKGFASNLDLKGSK